MINIPKRTPGRQSAASKARFDNELYQFASDLHALNRTIDFALSSRGWCYVLEEHGLLKPDFDYAQKLINMCRKSGLLPIDFTVRDMTRKAIGEEHIDDSDVEAHADAVWNTVDRFIDQYRPVSFWENQKYYIELAVEKIDLVGLFRPVANEFMIPVTNFKGWSDINARADMLNRFTHWYDKGKRIVLLYMGDHDPGGLNISDALYQNFEDLEEAVYYPDGLEIDRFGLNSDFINNHGLSWVDNLKTSRKTVPNDLSDPRHPDHAKSYVQTYLKAHGARKVEANALVVRPDAGRQLLRDTIDKYIDHDAIVDHEEQTETAQGYLREQLESTAQQWANQ